MTVNPSHWGNFLIADTCPARTVAGRRFDSVITLCDKAREVGPEFGHHPRLAHWSIPALAAVSDADQTSYPAFQHAAAEIDARIRYLLPVLARTPN